MYYIVVCIIVSLLEATMSNNIEKKNIADTMEINSILEEAKRSRNFQAPGVMNYDDEKTVVMNDDNQNNVIPRNQKNVDEDFIIYDDDIKNAKKAQKAKKPKNPKSKKKAVWITVICALVLVLFAAGFCVYKLYGEFEYANNIYVNGVNIGGMSQFEAKRALKAEEQKLADAIRIEVTAEQNSVTLTKDDLDYTFTTDDVLEQAKQYTEDTLVTAGDKEFKIAIKIDNQSCVDNAKKVAAELDRKAVNATVTAFDSSKTGNERFTFEDSKNGISVKQTELVTQMHSFVSDGTVAGNLIAPVDITEPKYSKDYLLANIKKLSGFTTTSTNNANGNANMALSLSKCNNSIINPGDTWSFNTCTGNSNLTSNGYKSAGVIVNGKMSTGIGGGICQSSTTIYNATLLCGMEVVERSCHYFKSSYVDAGRDATIDYGNIDLKMKNIFDYQLFMECYMDGVVLHCNMYGIPNPEFDEIKINSSVTSYFSNGFRAQASRTYYLDGKEVKTEALPNSTYYTSSPGGGSSNTPSDKPTEGTDTPTTPPEGGDTPTPPTEGGGGTDTPVTPPEGGGTDTPVTPPEGGGTDIPVTPPVVETPAE